MFITRGSSCKLPTSDAGTGSSRLIDPSCHWFYTDATWHCVSWRMLQQ